MRNIILSTLAALAVAIVPGFAAEGDAVAADNKNCACGKPNPADGKATVTIKNDEGKPVTYKVCCDGCATNIKAMDAKEANKAFAAHNKADAGGKKAN